jgi:hypothetical protein
MPLSSFTLRDDGTRNIPGMDSPWDAWVSATRTRNWVEEDPLLDWLDLFGEAKGFTRDTTDPRTDFGRFVMGKGIEFERVVLRALGERHSIAVIAQDRSAARSEDTVRRTWEAMSKGAKILAQAPIWNPQSQTYGIIDLAIRSDVLAELFPDLLSAKDARAPAPGIPGSAWHYRVVDIKFTGLHLLKDGHATSEHLKYAVQVFIYNDALGRLQGLTPPCAYLLGRGWEQLKLRGRSAFERLSRVDHNHVLKHGDSLEKVARQGCDWVRRVRAEGRAWNVLPAPSVPELWPNMRHTEDAPWSGAKKKIGFELEDLTLLPRVNPSRRSEAHASGLRRWTDPACSASRLGITTPAYSALLEAVIEANHSAKDGPVVFPARVTENEGLWRTKAPVEFFVDFETTSDLEDDFTTFPRRGGQPLIFMIGCGHSTPSGAWEFRVFTADRLEEPSEARILRGWLEHMNSACRPAGCTLAQARLYHWSPAEVSTLQSAYNSAAVRHGLPKGDVLPWVDLLANVAKAQPIGVRGAFGYGLKAITKAMHQHGLIPTVWGDGPTDGLGAMVGAWWCNAEARRGGGSMRDLELMRQIEAYNRVDVEAMRDILSWLREHR